METGDGEEVYIGIHLLIFRGVGLGSGASVLRSKEFLFAVQEA